MKNILATIAELFMLLMHLVKCISPPGPAVLHVGSQSSQDRGGVHSPSVSAPLDNTWQVLFPTTSLLSMALQSLSLSVLHPVELFRLQSRYHALNSLL